MTRSAEWGNWGITLVQWDTPERPYVPQIIGTVYFGVGSQGPIDGTIGSSTRQGYRDMVAAWMRDGIVPANIDTAHATDRIVA